MKKERDAELGDLKDNIMAINATFGRDAATAVVGTIEDRVKASMRAVLEENWMERHQQKLFQASIVGVLLTCETGDEDYQQIVDSIDALRKVGAMLELVKRGWKIDEPKLGMKATLPLYAWWHEVFAVAKLKITTVD